MISQAYDGEDVPITILYEDSSGNGVDPDDQGTDGVPDAYITITDDTDTAVVSSVEMTHNAAGDFEYVWDTSTASGVGEYEVEISADFSGETKITRDSIELV